MVPQGLEAAMIISVRIGRSGFWTTCRRFWMCLFRGT